jgi:hypothetical protein
MKNLLVGCPLDVRERMYLLSAHVNVRSRIERCISGGVRGRGRERVTNWRAPRVWTVEGWSARSEFFRTVLETPIKNRLRLPVVASAPGGPVFSLHMRARTCTSVRYHVTGYAPRRRIIIDGSVGLCALDGPRAPLSRAARVEFSNVWRVFPKSARSRFSRRRPKTVGWRWDDVLPPGGAETYIFIESPNHQRPSTESLETFDRMQTIYSPR